MGSRSRRAPASLPQRPAWRTRSLPWRAATVLMALLFVQPSCFTTILWQREQGAIEPATPGTFAAFRANEDPQEREELVLQLDAPTCDWVRAHGGDALPVGEWLLLRPEPGEHLWLPDDSYTRSKGADAESRPLQVWIVHPRDGGAPHWYVGEKPVNEAIVVIARYGMGGRCVATTLPTRPPQLGAPLPRTELAMVDVTAAVPLVVRIAATPVTLAGDALLIGSALTALVGGIVIAPVLLVGQAVVEGASAVVDAVK